METTPTRSPVVHDGEMPVVVVGQAGPRLDDLVVGTEHVRVCGHPPPDGIDERVGPGGRGPEEVPFGEDAGDGGPSVTTTEPICRCSSGGWPRSTTRRRRR